MAPHVPINSTPQLTLIIVPTLMLVLSTVAVVLRFYARTLPRQKLSYDDWLISASLILAYGLQVTMCISVVYGGVGVSVKTLHTSNTIVYLKTLIASGAIYGTAVTLVQLSILAFYVRLFGVLRWHNICCYVVMALCTAWWIAFFGGTMGDCVPLKKLWTPKLPGKCVDQNKACGSTGIAHIILDLIILFLPLPVVWRLRVSKAKKAMITCFFFIGIFATICSILRISCIVGLVKINHSDFTYTVWMSYLFETLEVATGIICTCCPAFPAVYTKASSSSFGSYTKRIFGSSKSTYGSNSFETKPSVDVKYDSGGLHPASSGLSRDRTESQVGFERLDDVQPEISLHALPARR